jgi:hypothetical protein
MAQRIFFASIYDAADQLLSRYLSPRSQWKLRAPAEIYKLVVRCGAKAMHLAPLDVQMIAGLPDARMQLARKGSASEQLHIPLRRRLFSV